MRNVNELAAKIFVSFCLIAGIGSHRVFADAGSAPDFSIHQEYLSTRAAGMGNAFTAVVDDHSALFYNPAALAFRKDGTLRMFFRGGLDIDYLSLSKDIDKINKEGGTDADKIDSMKDLLEKNYGNHYFFRVPTLGGFWARPRWGIALVPVDLSIDAVPHRGAGPSLSVNGYLDTTLAYGYGRTVNWFGGGHQFAWGATGKFIHRIHASKLILASELASGQKIFEQKDGNEGLTFDIDIGTLFVPKLSESSWMRFTKPSFAVVVRNALDYGFPTNLHVVDKESGKPPKLQRRIDVGSKFELPKFWVFDAKAAFDVRDMLHENWSLMKGLHTGAELGWTMFSWWKGFWSVGLNQGYWTAGFGARLAWFRLDLASYGEEVGTSDAKHESRRYMAEMSLEF